jgi:hypothetical protein
MKMDDRMAGAVDAGDRRADQFQERPRLKRRWTLGGSMILIAILALPLALSIRHIREVERMRRLEAEAAQAAQAQARANYERLRKAIVDLEHERLRVIPDPTSNPLPLAAPGTQGDPR